MQLILTCCTCSCSFNNAITSVQLLREPKTKRTIFAFKSCIYGNLAMSTRNADRKHFGQYIVTLLVHEHAKHWLFVYEFVNHDCNKYTYDTTTCTFTSRLNFFIATLVTMHNHYTWMSQQKISRLYS